MSLLTIISELEEQIDRIEETGQYIDFVDDVLPEALEEIRQTVLRFAGSGGNLEGDGGNDGYSSEVQGVISFAGGINDVDWIDANDEPLVSIQGTSDLTVKYNCWPDMNNQLILTLCGSGAMHPKADNVGVLNDHLSFSGTDHLWAASGNSNTKFVQALDFTTNFLYPLLPCNNATSISSVNSEKILIKITDLLGREIEKTINTPLFYIYSNGEVEKKIFIN